MTYAPVPTNRWQPAPPVTEESLVRALTDVISDWTRRDRREAAVLISHLADPRKAAKADVDAVSTLCRGVTERGQALPQDLRDAAFAALAPVAKYGSWRQRRSAQTAMERADLAVAPGMGAASPIPRNRRSVGAALTQVSARYEMQAARGDFRSAATRGRGQPA